MLDDIDIPGTRPRVAHKPAAEQPRTPDAWDARPKMLTINGRTLELFYISALARAINRSTRTIHAWEYKNLFPQPVLRVPRRGGQGLPGKRLYSRQFIEGVIRIAKEEGVYDDPYSPDIRNTNFTARVFELFDEVGG